MPSRILLALLAVGALAVPLGAHDREFTLSRDWHLPWAGEMELESRTFANTKSNDWVQQFEFEYGITDHFAVEPGLALKKRNGDRVEVEAAELELRLNFLDFGYGKLLPALNLEYERRVEDDDEDSGEEEPDNEVELKSILSLYTERGESFTMNLNFGRGFGGEGEREWEGEITAGYARSLDFIPGFEPTTNSEFKVGVEFSQQILKEHGTGLGPLFGWRVSNHLHMLSSYVFPLRDRDERSDELRVILELEF